MPLTSPDRSGILIVDDASTNIEVLAAVLQDDYELSIATSGAEALGLLARRTPPARMPDLILLDLLMPGMDGYEVCAALQRDPATRRIPVIVVTAQTDVESETKALAAGAVDFISKPFSREVVRARVRLHLDLVQRRAQLEQLNQQLERSIAEVEAANERLRHVAHHDALTNLPNRTLFFDRVAVGLALARRQGTRLALLFIDLDRFKPINDTWGHATGDLVLVEVARRMTGCVRESDTVGRIGGDEFVVLLQDIGSDDDAIAVAQKMRAALGRPFVADRRSLSLSASIGIALAPDHGRDPIELARNADAAMYCAKQAGRDNVQVFRREMRAEVADA